MEEWLGRASFNIISRGIGMIMRLSVVAAYIIAEIVFILALPFIIACYLILTPFLYIAYNLSPLASEKKDALRKRFLKERLLSEDNRASVEAWFESYYTFLHQSPWWSLQSLFSTPPLARGWSTGYTPTLDQYTEELTKPKKHFKDLVDREKEIRLISLILSKSESSNVLVVGDEGVGKHTIIEGLAKLIYEGKINPLLAYKRIVKLDIGSVISRTIDSVQREALLKDLLAEAAAAGNIIILIDHFDRYISGQGSDRIDLTAAIASFARSDKVQFIGVTSPFFYQKYVMPNAAIHRLFEKVDVYEISLSEAMKVAMKAAYEMEVRYRLIIPYETIKEAVEKSNFYITTIPFPEKAIALLDESCAYFKNTQKQFEAVITPDIADTVLTKKTHIPVTLDERFREKLLHLETLLSEKIISQPQAIANLGSTIRKSLMIAGSRKKPLASFLFLGPTGTGKTETAKVLADVFFGSKDYLIRFDMSFYQSKNDIAALIGSLDTGNPGIMTAAVRERPWGVLLLDEIEKAHSDLINIFLTVLDEGYFIDGYGKRVDCKNLIVVATSNAGSEFIFKQTDPSTPADLISYLVERKLFTPEFLNRFDGVIIYTALSKEALVTLVQKMLGAIAQEVYRMHGVRIGVNKDFLAGLIEKGYNPRWGARQMARIIRDEVEDTIAQRLLSGQIHKGETITF